MDVSVNNGVDYTNGDFQKAGWWDSGMEKAHRHDHAGYSHQTWWGSEISKTRRYYTCVGTTVTTLVNAIDAGEK